MVTGEIGAFEPVFIGLGHDGVKDATAIPRKLKSRLGHGWGGVWGGLIFYRFGHGYSVGLV